MSLLSISVYLRIVPSIGFCSLRRAGAESVNYAHFVNVGEEYVSTNGCIFNGSGGVQTDRRVFKRQRRGAELEMHRGHGKLHVHMMALDMNQVVQILGRNTK